MPLDNSGPSSSIGSLVAKAASKTAKKVSSSSSVKSSSNSTKRVKKSSGSSVGSSVGRAVGNSVSGSRRSSSGGGGRSVPSGGSIARATPQPPSLAAYLGTESVYQNALRGGKRNLADFLSDLTRRRGEATTQYNQTVGSMDRDRTQQLEDLKNEFASRGLIQSGLYADQVGQFNQKFTDQANALKQQQTALLADLLNQQNNYTRENQNALDQARQDAILRRAQKYSIG